MPLCLLLSSITEAHAETQLEVCGNKDRIYFATRDYRLAGIETLEF